MKIRLDVDDVLPLFTPWNQIIDKNTAPSFKPASSR